jgi:N-methylhydantoinase B/oxoprolinase/acetone carboxylase alpha subunit
MAGGSPGERGQNLLYYGASKRTVNLGGKNTVHVQPGDQLTILTPGGGGYGSPIMISSSSMIEGPAVNNTVVNNPTELKTSGSLSQYTLNQESV